MHVWSRYVTVEDDILISIPYTLNLVFDIIV